ncbi:PREDICTED: cyclin-A1-1-like [Prunus mume]|uniref:B-like cyclin n=1 Tax=Prunus mume TaxID=102107 RepID=A0ABM0N4Y0_PRUMU|nr:PREDICTED: cyclin-A1-1-like [Prunus mume]
MSTQNRRSAFPSSLAKRQALSSSSSSASGNAGKVVAAEPHLAKKRAPLSNLTNRNSVSNNGLRSSGGSSCTLVPCTNKIAKVKKGPPACTGNKGISASSLPASFNVKPSAVLLPKVTPAPRSDEAVPSSFALPGPCSMDVSPSKSDGNSVSMDETMSSCDSFKSPEVEYIDNNDVPAIDSINRKTFSNLYISDHAETTGIACKREVLVELEAEEKIADLDNSLMDPQLCATIACDIYKHLRASEVKKRPSTDFMEKTQKDINPSMRAILIDWLVEVAEEYRLVPDTLYLTVNYIDRYLSGNPMNRQRLQLLGVACMMIASKYEEICAPQVEEFCYITDNTYFKEEVLQMESDVLNYLKFEMTAPTTKCFLRRFVRAAQGANEGISMHLECLANYLAELSLLEYSMLCYAPSLVAASAIFLANFILLPSKRPWNATLQHYTLYQPSDLRDCVKELHRLCCNSQSSSLPAIREKYSQHKYKHVAKKYCPPTIPSEYQT